MLGDRRWARGSLPGKGCVAEAFVSALPVRSDAPPEQTPKPDDENGPHPEAPGPLGSPYYHPPRTLPGAYRPHPPPAQCSPLPRAPQIPRGSRSRSSSPSPPSFARLAHWLRPSAQRPRCPAGTVGPPLALRLPLTCKSSRGRARPAAGEEGARPPGPPTSSAASRFTPPRAPALPDPCPPPTLPRLPGLPRYLRPSFIPGRIFPGDSLTSPPPFLFR